LDYEPDEDDDGGIRDEKEEEMSEMRE